MQFDPSNQVQAAHHNQQMLDKAKASGKQVIYKLHKREGVVEVKVAKYRSPIRWLVNAIGRKLEKRLLIESFSRNGVRNTTLQERLISIDSDNTTSFMHNRALSKSAPPPSEPVLENDHIDLLSLTEEVDSLPTPMSPEPAHFKPAQGSDDDGDDEFFESQDHTMDGSTGSLLKQENEASPEEFKNILWSILKEPLDDTSKLVASALGLDADRLPEWQASAMASPVGYSVNQDLVNRDKKAQLSQLFAMEKEASKLRVKMPNISPVDTQDYLTAYVSAGLYASELPVDLSKGGFALAAELKAVFGEYMSMEYQQTLSRAAISALHEIYGSETGLASLLQERLTQRTTNPIQTMTVRALHNRAYDKSGNIDPRDRMTVEDFNLLRNFAYGAEGETYAQLQEALAQDIYGVKLSLEMENLTGYLSEFNTREMQLNMLKGSKTIAGVNKFLSEHPKLDRCYKLVKNLQARPDWRWDTGLMTESRITGREFSKQYNKMYEIYQMVDQALLHAS